MLNYGLIVNDSDECVVITHWLRAYNFAYVTFPAAEIKSTNFNHCQMNVSNSFEFTTYRVDTFIRTFTWAVLCWDHTPIPKM